MGRIQSYSSKNEWYKSAWEAFHLTALSFPINYYCGSSFYQQQQKYYQYYYQTFLDLIKCPSCLSDYKALINMYPINLSSRDELFAWTALIHNCVNQKIGHPFLSLEQAVRYWYPQGYASIEPECSSTECDYYGLANWSSRC